VRLRADTDAYRLCALYDLTRTLTWRANARRVYDDKRRNCAKKLLVRKADPFFQVALCLLTGVTLLCFSTRRFFKGANGDEDVTAPHDQSARTLYSAYTAWLSNAYILLATLRGTADAHCWMQHGALYLHLVNKFGFQIVPR
jgi:hypothetical protein